VSLIPSGLWLSRIRSVGMAAARLALRVAVLRGFLVGRAGLMLLAQPGAGIAAILANTLTIALAHGQFEGIRSLRRRPPVVSLAPGGQVPRSPRHEIRGLGWDDRLLHASVFNRRHHLMEVA
jgi:hypothetical protein